MHASGQCSITFEYLGINDLSKNLDCAIKEAANKVNMCSVKQIVSYSKGSRNKEWFDKNKVANEAKRFDFVEQLRKR